MNSRAQSALEYLMTYGWALIVIVIAIAALVMLINPASIQGDSCDTKLGPFTISDETRVTAAGIDLVLVNNAGRETTNMDFTAGGEFAATLVDQNMTAGDTSVFTIAGTVAGEYTIDLDLTYDTENVTGHAASAQCRGTV